MDGWMDGYIPACRYIHTSIHPSIPIQAEDRIHRLGQTAEVVRYKYLISDGTVDKQMWTSMIKKEATLSSTTGLGENAKKDWSTLGVCMLCYAMDGCMQWRNGWIDRCIYTMVCI